MGVRWAKKALKGPSPAAGPVPAPVYRRSRRSSALGPFSP